MVAFQTIAHSCILLSVEEFISVENFILSQKLFKFMDSPCDRQGICFLLKIQYGKWV